MFRPADDELATAIGNPNVVARFLSKIVPVPGSECLYWTGAISGAGHGRYWVADQKVVIAHRFAYALVHGLENLPALLGHRCDNPLCQRISPEHVVPSSPHQNRAEWVIRRDILNGPLADPRGPRGRAQALRDLARTDPAFVTADILRVSQLVGHQPVLF